MPCTALMMRKTEWSVMRLSNATNRSTLRKIGITVASATARSSPRPIPPTCVCEVRGVRRVCAPTCRRGDCTMWTLRNKVCGKAGRYPRSRHATRVPVTCEAEPMLLEEACPPCFVFLAWCILSYNRPEILPIGSCTACAQCPERPLASCHVRSMRTSKARVSLPSLRSAGQGARPLSLSCLKNFDIASVRGSGFAKEPSEVCHAIERTFSCEGDGTVRVLVWAAPTLT